MAKVEINWLFPEPVIEAFLEHALMMEELEKDGTDAIKYEAHREAGALLKRAYDGPRKDMAVLKQ